MHYNRNNRGFTLIELLVVISVITMIASIILVGFNSARLKARDAFRLATAHQVITALNIYYQNNGSYPDSTAFDPGAAAACGGWDVSTGSVFLQPLVTSGIIASAPKDPLNNGGCAFDYPTRHYAFGFIPQAIAAGTSTHAPTGNVLAYQYFPAGTYGCDVKRGNFYVLGIKNMETITPGYIYPASPGFNCSGHNWQVDFVWVTGQFER